MPGQFCLQSVAACVDSAAYITICLAVVLHCPPCAWAISIRQTTAALPARTANVVSARKPSRPLCSARESSCLHFAVIDGLSTGCPRSTVWAIPHGWIV